MTTYGVVVGYGEVRIGDVQSVRLVTTRLAAALVLLLLASPVAPATPNPRRRYSGSEF